jgi:trigger factor
LILNRIAEKEGIKVDEQALLHRISLIAQHRSERPEKVLREMQQNGQINAVVEQILTAKVLDFLQLQALVSEIPGIGRLQI